MLLDCLDKLGKTIKAGERQTLEESYRENLKEGKSEYEAGIAALVDFHKALFDEVNELRQAVKLPPGEYRPYDPGPINAKYDKLIAAVSPVPVQPERKQETKE